MLSLIGVKPLVQGFPHPILICNRPDLTAASWSDFLAFATANFMECSESNSQRRNFATKGTKKLRNRRLRHNRQNLAPALSRQQCYVIQPANRPHHTRVTECNARQSIPQLAAEDFCLRAVFGK